MTCPHTVAVQAMTTPDGNAGHVNCTNCGARWPEHISYLTAVPQGHLVQASTNLQIPDGKRIVNAGPDGSYVSKAEARWYARQVDNAMRHEVRETRLALGRSHSFLAAAVKALEERTWRARWARFLAKFRRRAR
jgi:hypothetical protein